MQKSVPLFIHLMSFTKNVYTLFALFLPTHNKSNLGMDVCVFLQCFMEVEVLE
jgi:hypothetical protein